MGANLGANVIRGIIGMGGTPEQRTARRRQRRVGAPDIERFRSRIGQRDTFLGGIQPFGGGQRRGGGLFGGAASTAAQQTFGT